MISAGIAVEGHGHGVHGLGLGGPGPGPGAGPGPGGPYLNTYPPPMPSAAAAHDWRHKQEFLRPAPKIGNNVGGSRYNGSAPLNGTRLLKYSPPTPHPATHPISHLSPSTTTTLPPPSLPSSLPVNLSSGVKEDSSHATQPDDLASYYPRLYPPPGVGGVGGVFSGLYGGPYGLYSSPYGQMVRVASAAAAAVGYVAPPPLSPLEHQYSPPATSPHTPGGPGQGQTTFVTPAQTQFSASVRKELARERERDREREREKEREREREREKKVVQGFKVPCGKEGSLKHRILPRVDAPRPSKHFALSKPLPSNNNNTVVPGNFAKGSLIQLATGQLRKVEDMTTEDFVLSAERSPELRLAESTVVRVMEKGEGVVITLTYNQNRTQVEFEATVEHPFFVYGQGWASCSPDRTLQHYGLKVHRLQVGDILVSLTPREPSSSSSTTTTYDLSRRESVTVTTATTTSMTARQVTRPSVSTAPATLGTMPPPASQPPMSTSSVDSSFNASRKRRWSAPDQITDEHDQVPRGPKECTENYTKFISN